MLDTRADSSADLTMRKDLRAGDLGAIVRLHGTIYTAECGFDARFEAGVAATVAAAVEAGWPAKGALRVAEWDGRVRGSAALTIEGPGKGRLRWVLVDPALRGRGAGRRMLADVVADADALGLGLLDLITFDELRTAAGLYRSHGFEVIESWRSSDWGRPILMQRYERRRPA